MFVIFHRYFVDPLHETYNQVAEFLFLLISHLFLGGWGLVMDDGSIDDLLLKQQALGGVRVVLGLHFLVKLGHHFEDGAVDGLGLEVLHLENINRMMKANYMI